MAYFPGSHTALGRHPFLLFFPSLKAHYDLYFSKSSVTENLPLLIVASTVITGKFSTMGITKDCISSPLEAGSSLNSQKLPAPLNQALDYVSDRLMRKHVHLTLIVIRKELPSASVPSSPLSPTPSRSSSRSSFSKLHLPSLPGSPRSIKSPASSCSSSFSSPSISSLPSLSRRSTAIQEPEPYGLSLLHMSDVPPKISQYFDESIAKAKKKFSLASDWLCMPSSSTSSASTSAFGLTLTTDLIRRSIQQHDVVYGSESLTLLAVDHIYTFKLALSKYSQTFTPSTKDNRLSREEKLKKRNQAKIRALDELRALVLFQKCRPIGQSYLLRSYDHLSVSVPALRSVNEAYKTCFHADGIDIEAVRPIVASSPLLRSPSGKSIGSRLAQDMMMKSGSPRVDMGPYYRAPATPTGYEEVTPVTRNEWDNLMWGRSNVGRVEIC